MAASPPSRLLVVTHAVAALVLVLFMASVPPHAQDFLPFYVAATLAAEGESTSIYPPADAESLFELSPRFLERARAIDPSTPENQVTAYVASPLALLIVSPLVHLPYGWALGLWRVLMVFAIGASAALLLPFGRSRPKLWTYTLLGLLPIALASLEPGQSSPLLLLAIVLTMREPSPWVSGATIVTLTMAIALKSFPIAFLPFLLVLGDWRTAAGTLALLAASLVVCSFLFPLELLGDFAGSLANIRGHVIPDWNNASFDAGLMRLYVGEASSSFVTPPLWVSVLFNGLKATLVLATLWLVRRRSDLPRDERLAAGWVAVFAVLPIVWPHYFIISAALVAVLIDRRRPTVAASAIIASIACAAPLLLRVNGIRAPQLLGTLGSLAWLGAFGIVWGSIWWGARPDSPEAATLATDAR